MAMLMVHKPMFGSVLRVANTRLRYSGLLCATMTIAMGLGWSGSPTITSKDVTLLTSSSRSNGFTEVKS